MIYSLQFSYGNNFMESTLNSENANGNHFRNQYLEIRLKFLKQKLVDSDRIIESRIQALQDEKDRILKKFNKKISDFKQEIKNCTLHLIKRTSD